MRFIKIIILILLGLPLLPIISLDEWMYVYHPTLNDSYILEKMKQYQTISITGYKIDQYGNLKININILKYQDLLQNKKIYPLISLSNAKEGKIFLSNITYRKNGIMNIVILSQNPLFDGVHIDFEYLTEKETVYFVEFLKELKEKLSHINKKLTIALFPPIWQLKYNQFHKIELLHPFIDEVVLMTYDQHNPKTNPGPITELNWIEENLNYLLKYIPKEKIYLGIPLYGYDWEINTNQTHIVDNQYYRKIINGNLKKIITKSMTYGTKIEFFDNKNTKKILFYPDEEFRNEIKEFAKNQKVKGIAYWRLGFEK